MPQRACFINRWISEVVAGLSGRLTLDRMNPIPRGAWLSLRIQPRGADALRSCAVDPLLRIYGANRDSRIESVFPRCLLRRWFNLNNCYAYRDDNLRHLGFPSYQAYLDSDLWQSIRARVLAGGALCAKCHKRPAAQVHHRAYDPQTLRGDDLASLTPLCRGCHKRAERPFDRGQSRYDRFMAANQFVLSKKHPRERAILRAKRGPA